MKNKYINKYFKVSLRHKGLKIKRLVSFCIKKLNSSILKFKRFALKKKKSFLSKNKKTKINYNFLTSFSLKTLVVFLFVIISLPSFFNVNQSKKSFSESENKYDFNLSNFDDFKSRLVSFLPTEFFDALGIKNNLSENSTQEFKLAIEINQGDKNDSIEGKVIQKGDQYSAIVEQEDLKLNFDNLRSKPDKLNMSFREPKEEDKEKIKTKILYLNNDEVKAENTKVAIKKNNNEKINAIVTCSDENFDKENNTCHDGWQLADISFKEKNNEITFSVKHFSAYAGAYLEIVNVQSNLTQGDDWTVNFNTYGQSDLKIEAVDGTNYPTDIQFESISCGAREIESSRIERSGNIITIKDYQCEGETSKIKNKAVTSGRHWLSFTFGDTAEEKAHNFACNTGTLSDICTVSSSNTMTNSDTISGSGSLVVASGGIITAAAGDRFTITMTGDVTIQSGGTITGNVTINATNVNVNSGGTINVDGKGYIGGLAGNGSGTGGGYGDNAVNYASGGGYGGAGGASTYYSGGTTYGSITAPTDLGSGGGGSSNTGVRGGSGGGAIKIVATGTVTVDGAITATGNTPTSGNVWCGGGSGGSIWIQTGILAGAGSVTANGGAGGYAGGGGGRIVLDPETSDTFTGSITTTGGIYKGEMGTIVRDTVSSPADITIASATSWIGSIYNTSGTAGSFTFNSLTVNTGITLTASVSITTVSDLTVTGAISANGQGYAGGYRNDGAGPGAGQGTYDCSYVSGGGYGGIGGTSAGTTGGTTYGSATEPTYLGSGGGGASNTSGRGGAGGGAIKIVTGGTLTVSGSVTANGASGSGGYAGGSGGSIWIQTGILAGAGSVTANGGNDNQAGGGGRIRLEYNNKTYNGTLTVAGGSGTHSGAVGTIYDISSSVTAPVDGSIKGLNPTISGTAVSGFGSLSEVEILVKDNTADSCWNGSVWTTCPTDSADWPDATGTDNWSYTGLTAGDYTDDHSYTVRSRATDNSVTEVPGIGNTFTYDGVAPEISLSYDLSHPVKDSDTLRVTATFDEEVKDSPVPQIAISYTGGGSLSATNMTKTDTTHYYYDVNVPSGSDGSASITISSAEDLVGNSLDINKSVNFTTEGNYTQEDATNGTDFESGKVMLNLTTDASTKLLLHNDGTENSFADSSASNNTMAVTGNVTQSANQSKFGGKSAYFDGSSTYLTTSYDTALFDWWTSDYTIDTWVYLTSYTGRNSSSISTMIGNMNPTSDANYWSFGPNKNGHLSFYYWNGSSNIIESSETISLNEWTHVAMSFSGSTIKLFINGVQVASGTKSGTPQSGLEFPLVVGQNEDGVTVCPFAGYVDELRVLKGIARWTSDFDLPTSIYGKPYYITTTDSSQINTSNYAHINDIDITQTTPTDTSIKYLVSFDDRSTWKYWDGNSWETSTLDDIQTNGMTKTTIEELSQTDWESSGGFVPNTTTTLDFLADLNTSDPEATPELDNIQVNYLGYPNNNTFTVDNIAPSNVTGVTGATGGTITTDGNYTIHTFTSGGTFTPLKAGDVDYLIVAGGGGGGHANGGDDRGGGGGGGGLLTGTKTIDSQSYSIVVGDGGTYTNNGLNSIFDDLTAIGGGAGGSGPQNGASGGSGGGGGAYRSSGNFTGGSGTQGYAGGTGGTDSVTYRMGGGGGGAGEVGDSAHDAPINGGDGIQSSISGLATYYAGGGAGGGSGGSGGAGGGGNCASAAGSVGTNGQVNTGGGGGGSSSNTTTAGNGGSGVVIIRYLTSSQSLEFFSSNATKKGGDSVAVTSTGDATNNIWFAPNGTTDFVAGATMTTAIGTATSILVPNTNGDYKFFVLDAAGNISNESTATLTVDATAPTASITYSPDRAVKSGESLTITATFSEVMADSPVPQIAITGSNSQAAINMTKTDTTHCYYTHTVASGDGVATVVLSAGTDVAGNVVTSAPTSGATFTVDNTNPNVSLSYDLSHPVKDSDTLRVTATFDEEVKDSPVPQIAISYTGGGSLSATNMTKTDTTHYYYDVNVPSGSDGTATITISNTEDLAGNSNNAATSNTFTVDNTKSLLSSLTLSDPTPTKAGTVDFTLEFNETMDTGTNPTVTFGTSAPYNQHSASANGSWTDSNTFFIQTTIPDDGTWDGTNTIKVSGAKDTAGNTIDDNTANTFVIDTVKLFLSSLTLSDPTPTKAGTVDFTLEFNETMDTGTNPTVTFGTSAPYNQHSASANGSWTDSNTFFIQTTIPDDGTWDGTNTIKVSGAKDTAGNTIDDNTANTFVIDTADPTSSVDIPEASGEYWNITDISGTASDSNALDTIYISIKDATNGSLWWSGTDWSIDNENDSWIPVTSGTTSWTYDAEAAHVSWTVDSDYLIKSKAIDTAGNIEVPGTGNEFTFVNSHPVVSNVIATQKNDSESNVGKVEVSYDVTDTESSSTTISLFYNSGATLSANIINSSSTASIQTSDGSRFPDSGIIMIKKGTGDTTQYEYILYTGKSVNSLTGISRSQEGTAGTDHTSGEQIWIKATSVSDEYGSQDNGSGKTILWDAPADADLYSASMTIRVASNDGASSNNIGIGDSTTFEFDTQIPVISSVSIDASVAVVSDSDHPASLAFNVTDDTTKQMMISTDVGFSGASWVAYSATPTVMLESDPDTVYVKFKDAKGNTSEISTLVTPETPTDFMVQDTSNVMITPTENRLFIAWKTVADSIAGFESYNIYRSGNQIDWVLKDTIDQIGTNYYGDNSVSANVQYYYRVVTEDTNGNKSFNSLTVNGNANGVQDAGEGGGGTEATAPVITNVLASSFNTTQAIITWDTNEASNSTVGYSYDGEAPLFVHETGVATMKNNAAGLGQHSVVLSGLTPNTKYYYQVKSKDPSLNEGTNNNVGGVGYTFTTLAGPIISAVNISNIQNTSATINWTTNSSSNSYATYSSHSDMSSSTETGNDVSTTTHSINITGLTAGTKYYFFVESGISVDNNATSYYSFITSSDTTGPVITFNKNTQITDISDTAATISWTTNEASTAKVSYGLTNGSYTWNSQNTNLNIDHSINLTGLTASTTYRFKIESTDANNNPTTLIDGATDFTFTTSATPDVAGPVVSDDVTVSATTPETATITWTTNENSSSFVQYATAKTDFVNIYKESGKDDDAVTNHSVTIEGLTQGTHYYFRVRSVDSSENETIDNDDGNYYEFTSNSGPTITSVVSSPSANSAVITWTTGENSDAYVAYSANADLSNPKEKGDPSKDQTSQSVTLDGLNSGATYYFKVRSTNADDGVTTNDNIGGYYSFVTLSDTTGPVIAVVPNADPIDSVSAVINWTTNEASTSKVEYGTTSGSLTSSTTLNANLNVNHSVILDELTPDTEYFFHVISKDGSNNSTTSIEYSFTTDKDSEYQHDALSEISDIADPPSIITDTKAVVTFNTDQAAQCTIEYGTQALTYDEVPVVESDYNVNHSMHVTGLIFSTTYYYQITCVDNLGNTKSSIEYSFPTAIKADETVDDVTAPEISSIGSGTITGESATITWTTDEESNSSVAYGITSGTYENIGGNYLVNSDSENFVTDHTVIINNLIPGTKYFYTVMSVDIAGNIGESTEQTLTTESPSTLSSIKVVSTSLNTATITWTTDKNMTSVVEYGLTVDYGDSKTSNTAAKTHEISLSGLKASTIYHFRVKGEDPDNNLYSSGDYTFEPKSPPKISTSTVGSVTEHEAKISVATDIPTDILVTYTSTSDSSLSGSQGKPEFVTKHDIDLKNLESGKTYSYVVKVTDEQGNQTTSDAKTFTTGKDENAPEISQVKTDNALAQNDKVQAIISWITNEPSNTSFIYKEGMNGEEKEIMVGDSYTQNHIVISTIFKPGTVYHFKVKSVDQSGNESISSDFALLTPKRKENIVQIIVTNFQDIFGWAKLVGGK